MIPVIWHIPHASTYIPEQYIGAYCADLSQELLMMTDLYTDDLFNLPLGQRVISPVSRLLCDVERFRDDSREEMSRCGMGAIYTTCHDLKPLRNVSAWEKEQLLKTYYDSHHARLTDVVEQQLAEFGQSLIVDCHSFSATPLPYETDQNPNRPDFCIGTDTYHTPTELITLLMKEFSRRGFRVTENSPYAGALVPMKFYQKDPRVSAVMIEVNRGLYMDASGNKSTHYVATQSDIQNVLFSMVNFFFPTSREGETTTKIILDTERKSAL